MSVNGLNLPINHTHSINAIRVLGIIGMTFAPALYIGWFFHGAPDGPKDNQLFASIFGVLYLSGAMASAIAMRQMRVTGNGVGAAILFAVQITGLLLAMGFDVFEYVAPHLRGNTIFFITDLAYPFSHVLMTIVGIAVWKTRVWSGWRVIPAFLCGLALPLFFAASAVFGRENSGWIFIGGVTLGFFLLGLAVKTSK
jgi:tryptophan-rich sensory protein